MGWTGHQGGPLLVQQIWRRAGGRRRYHTTQRLRAVLRRGEVYRLWQQQMSYRAMARCLAVHHSTVSRDVTAIRLGLHMFVTQQITAVTVGELLRHVPPRHRWQAIGQNRQDNEEGRKRMSSPRLSVRVSPSLLGELEQFAQQRQITVSDLVKQALVAFCRQTAEADAPPPSEPAHASETSSPLAVSGVHPHTGLTARPLW